MVQLKPVSSVTTVLYMRVMPARAISTPRERHTTCVHTQVMGDIKCCSYYCLSFVFMFATSFDQHCFWKAGRRLTPIMFPAISQ